MAVFFPIFVNKAVEMFTGWVRDFTKESIKDIKLTEKGKKNSVKIM